MRVVFKYSFVRVKLRNPHLTWVGPINMFATQYQTSLMEYLDVSDNSRQTKPKIGNSDFPPKKLNQLKSNTRIICQKSLPRSRG